MHRAIVHLDADAFFAAVEQAADAKLRGRPIAVGGEKRGIIASASYEARAYGVYTPMPTVRARKLCPKLVVIPGDYERYEQFSQWMFGYCYDFTPDVEQTSIDEGYFDLTSNRAKPAADIALIIRKAISQRLKITVSEGIGSNKLVSAVASKLHKPSAFYQVPNGGESAFLHPLPVKWLPGIGPAASARLNAAGLVRICHIAATPLEMLELLLGNRAAQLREFANGIDQRMLIPAREPQRTFSEQQTFGIDLTDEEFVLATLKRMADDLFAKIRGENRSVRTLTVKVRYNDMEEVQASESMLEPTDLESDIYGWLHALLKQAWKRRVSLRLVSLKLSNIYDGRFRGELPLDIPPDRMGARERLASVVDDMRRLKGRSSILRGHDLLLRAGPRDALASQPKQSRRAVRRTVVANYVPLRTHSHYSFLDSTLSPEEIVKLATHNDMSAVALTDTGNLHGSVEFVLAAQKAGIKPILGVELRYDGKPLLLYVESTRGYANLCRLLSHQGERAQSRAEESVVNSQRKEVGRETLARYSEGLIAVGGDAGLARFFPGAFYRLAASREMPGNDRAVAAPAVHYADAEDWQRYNILQSIRTLTLLNEEHPDKQSGGRLHFRTQSEMGAACAKNPEWLRHGIEIAERCSFVFPFGKPQFPPYHPKDGTTMREFLKKLVMDGLAIRYHARAPQYQKQVDEEISIIAAVGYEGYFLMVWEILQECRAHGIEWITRGSAADSMVCYCLGISDVCPIRFDLYFKRFLNPERMALNKLPDIDIDFPHDRKDDVVRLIFERYGAEYCAMVGGFSTFQLRSAFAEIAKVLGVGERDVRKFTERFPWSLGGWKPAEPASTDGAGLIEALRSNPEIRDLPMDEEPYRTALDMAAFLDGRPRYPKMHPCGMVLSCQPMHELSPTFISNKGLPTTHYNMDAVELIGLVKMDILAQGGLAVMRDAKKSLQKQGVAVDFGKLEPWADPHVWEMIASGGSRAVHHIESPAMVSLCRMTNVREIDGLIAIVSVIRPGAANETKKLSFTRRYQGFEPVSYLHPCLEPCLKSTFGLVAYEEHILQICEVFAGMSAGHADMLRRALVKQQQAVVAKIGTEFTQAARQQGHDEKKIVEVWELVAGFSGYAFNKAHSTAYGVEAYQSAWLKYYHPAEFMAGVLTHGKGFYHPIVYVLECHRLGLSFLPPSVNEPGPAFIPHGRAIRVPLTHIKGLRQQTTERILAAHAARPFESIQDFFHRVNPNAAELESMIRVGAFDEFGDTRTRQFWQAQHLLKTFSDKDNPAQGWLIPRPGLHLLFPSIPFEEPSFQERLQAETDLFGFAVSGHPLEMFGDVAWDSYCPVSRLGEFIGQTVTTCGLIVEQRIHHQVTGEPMKFLSLADWSGIIETELFAQTYKTYGLTTVRYPALEIEAKVEPFENRRGHTLRVLRAGQPRRI